MGNTEEVAERAFEGEPTILLVDDEDLMREVSAIMIEDHGGKVIEAVDGQHAVELYSEKSDEIDVVVMDFSMPRKNGYEALVEMKQINPNVKVILISGLSLTHEVEELRDSGDLIFLGKPFRESDLIEAIAKARFG